MNTQAPQRSTRMPTLERIVFEGTPEGFPAAPLFYAPRPAPVIFEPVIVEPAAIEPEVKRRDRNDFVDNRPEVAKSLHESGEYNIPKASRRGMIADLASRPLYTEGGHVYLGWNIRMDFPWNKTGHVRDAHDVSPDCDQLWEDAIKNDPTIFHRACENALKPWVTNEVDVLEMDGAMLCDLHLKDLGRDALLLKSFAGEPIRVTRRDEWRQYLDARTDSEIGNLWVATRVLDADLSKPQRAEIMADEYNTIRHEMEEEWNAEVEHLPF